VCAASKLPRVWLLAHFDRQTGKSELEKEELGARQVRISRNIEGIPVFSSHAVLGFNSRGEIGFMEVHWPEIPGYVLAEAHRLEYKVKNGWRPPEQKEAVVESVEAGIIHSPAVGFLMDIYPAIRVIYAPVDSDSDKNPFSSLTGRARSYLLQESSTRHRSNQKNEGRSPQPSPCC
jgi:hypothetical protein